MELLKSLIIVSEKAANIARLCRQNQHLFELLIEEKPTNEANPRFVNDFKTLADVLIQEMVKYQIGNQFPVLRDSIQGEENNKFCNQLGECIDVEIKNTPEQTSDLLKIVLNNDNEAAELLANEIHKDVQLEQMNIETNFVEFDVDYENLGIWIDPIDSTAEYINGGDNIDKTTKICHSGLQCVTVLLGVYQKNDGLPIIGVINQPFADKTTTNWIGSCIWNVSLPSLINDKIIPSSSSSSSSLSCSNKITISASEDPRIVEKLKRGGFELIEIAGAGYKMLNVIENLVDAYILTKNSTYKWDTCGPQAILRSLNGDLIVYNEAINGNLVSVRYNDCNRCNYGGIIAYKNRQVLEKILKCLK